MVERDRREQIQSIVWQSLTEAEVPGAAIAIHINGKPWLTAGVGYCDRQHQVPLPTNAQFYIYSITKSLIATAVLHYVNDGLLDLDQPLQNDLTVPLEAAITLRQLLSHTSGVPDYGGLSAYSTAVKANPTVPWSTDAFLDVAYSQGLLFAPGQGWAYSNIGYLILKGTLEQATGRSLQQILDAVIFEPLSLKQTVVPTTLNDVVALTPGYTTYFNAAELQSMTHCYHPGWVAHGVVVSTAPELANLIDALGNGEILSRHWVEQMMQPLHRLGKHSLFADLGYGLGTFTDTASPYGRVVGHTGEGPGYSVAAFHFSNLADANTTIVALANRDRPDFGLTLVEHMVHALSEHT